MPAGDGTGPAGQGPMTGRAAGFCAGYPRPGYANPVGRQGFFGFGRGRGGPGRGWRNQFYATGMTGWQRAAMGYPSAAYNSPVPPQYAAPTNPPQYAAPTGPAVDSQQQLDALKGQAEYLEDALEGIRKRIQELESNG